MADFVENYIATAATDPATAFGMLTPAFQQQSGGMSGYVRFWGDVTQRQGPGRLGGPGHARGELHLPLREASRRAAPRTTWC